MTPKARPKMTLTDICFEFQFTTRQGKHERADVKYLLFSLEPYLDEIRDQLHIDLASISKRKALPYPLIVYIFKKFL